MMLTAHDCVPVIELDAYQTSQPNIDMYYVTVTTCLQYSKIYIK